MSGAVKWGPWIGWNGGECPVAKGAIVEACTKYGYLPQRDAEAIKWWSGYAETIVAYRVQIQPDVETVTMYGDGLPDTWRSNQSHGDTHSLTYTMTDGVIDCGSEKMVPL